MLPGMERGPKPTKWVSGAKVNFEAFFARRSEPFRAAPDESPLIEVTAAGEGWMFSGFGDESTQVRSTVGGSIRNIVVDITGTMVMLGSGQDPGQGSCQRYAVLNEVEVPEGTPFAQSRVRGGTGDLQLRLARSYGTAAVTAVRGRRRTSMPIISGRILPCEHSL
jgi:hypothetical protein